VSSTRLGSRSGCSSSAIARPLLLMHSGQSPMWRVPVHYWTSRVHRTRNEECSVFFLPGVEKTRGQLVFFVWRNRACVTVSLRLSANTEHPTLPVYRNWSLVPLNLRTPRPCPQLAARTHARALTSRA
jgi:hypothetical protein